MTIQLISKNASNQPANNGIFLPYGGGNINISGDLIVFSTEAFNFIPDANGAEDIYLYNKITKTFSNLTALKANGTATTLDSSNPSISGNGNKIVFQSSELDLATIPGIAPNNIFLVENFSSTPPKFTLLTAGYDNVSYNPFISQNGNWVVFETFATTQGGATLTSAGDIGDGDSDIILVNVNDPGNTKWVSQITNQGGNSGFFTNTTNASVSADGRYVVFQSDAPDLIPTVTDVNGSNDIFLFDTQNNSLTLVSRKFNSVAPVTSGNSSSDNPIISADGRYIAYESFANDLVSVDTNGFTDIFVYDIQQATNKLISLRPNAVQTTAYSRNPTISENGQFVAFESDDISLVPNDTNNLTDIFVWNNNTISLFSADSAGNEGNKASTIPSISPNGQEVAFISNATNLDPSVIGQDGITQQLFLASATTQPPITDPLLNTPFTRFQNSVRSGTYLFAGPGESQSVRQNFPNFVEEGTAFKVAVEANDALIRINRFQNTNAPGTYLFAGQEESQSIRQNFPNFVEEGVAFYVYDGNAGKGVDFYRFQNTQQPGTYLFVGEQERNSILANFPQFQLEGVAFEVAV